MAGRPRGIPKTPGSGRKKGANFAGQLRCDLEKRKIDLIGMFFEDLERVTEFHKRCELTLKFMEFVYPKPRIDVALSVKDMEPEDFKEFMKDGVARIRSERTPS